MSCDFLVIKNTGLRLRRKSCSVDTLQFSTCFLQFRTCGLVGVIILYAKKRLLSFDSTRLFLSLSFLLMSPRRAACTWGGSVGEAWLMHVAACLHRYILASRDSAMTAARSGRYNGCSAKCLAVALFTISNNSAGPGVALIVRARAARKTSVRNRTAICTCSDGGPPP